MLPNEIMDIASNEDAALVRSIELLNLQRWCIGFQRQSTSAYDRRSIGLNNDGRLRRGYSSS